MKPQKQLNRHDPENGVWGDCHRTAIAIMLDMDATDVPHFCDGNRPNNEVNADVAKFLDFHGFNELSIPIQTNHIEDVFASMRALNPGIYFILGGTSRNGVHHSVVCDDNGIVCDPSLDDSGIVGPCSDGMFWLTYYVSARFVRNDTIVKEPS